MIGWEEDLLKKIDRIEQANGDHKHGEAWKVVNEMTGRKKAKEGQAQVQKRE